MPKVQTADGQVRDMSLQELQGFDPGLYSSYVKSVAQPQASLEQTRASTGAEGASAANSMLSAQQKQVELGQVRAFDLIQKLFESKKGSDQKVSPDTYNSAKSSLAALGINSDEFDKKFEASYTNPSNFNYDTPTDNETRRVQNQTKNLLQATLDSYNSIPEDQKGPTSKAILIKTPFLGQFLAPQATEYENQRQGLSAQFKDIAGAGQGSGVRVTQTELNNWSNLLPSPTKTKTQNDYDLKQLNSLMEAKFGKGNGVDSHYLPSKGRPALSNFNQ